jgi:hypothetical protein
MNTKYLWANYIQNLKQEAKTAIAKGICVKCKKAAVTFSEAGAKEYNISGLCENCFDKITKDED